MPLARNILCLVLILVPARDAFPELVLAGGIAAGVNVTNWTVKDSTGMDVDVHDNRIGFIGGVIGDVAFNEGVSVMPGMQYTMRGAVQEGFGTKTVIALNYLSIPVLIRAKFKAGSVRPFVAVGPDIGFLLAANARIEGTMYGAAIDSSFDIKDEAQRVDLGLDMVAGAEFSICKLVPYVQAGYYFGLTNIIKDPVADESTKNKGILVQAGVCFKL